MKYLDSWTLISDLADWNWDPPVETHLVLNKPSIINNHNRAWQIWLRTVIDMKFLKIKIHFDRLGCMRETHFSVIMFNSTYLYRKLYKLLIEEFHATMSSNKKYVFWVTKICVLWNLRSQVWQKNTYNTEKIVL